MSADPLKIYFCDLCTESIPLRDLELGTAISIKGKLICALCNSSMTQKAAGGQPAGSFAASSSTPSSRPAQEAPPQGSLVLGSLGMLLGAVSLVLIFFFRESTTELIHNSERQSRDDVRSIQLDLGRIQKEISAEREDLERRIRQDYRGSLDTARDSTAMRLEGLQQNIDSLSKNLERFEKITRRMESMEAWSEAAKQNLASIKAELETFNQEVRSVKEAVAKIPKEQPAQDGGMRPAVARPAIQGWEEMVRKLNDPDPGTRWNAVIDLGQTGDPRAVPHLIPLLKDEDVFVRNNVAQTLGELDAKNAVAALIEALGDEEHFVRDSAYTSLKRITKENLKFDPLGRKEDRERAIKGWQKWWDANKEKFLGSTAEAKSGE